MEQFPAIIGVTPGRAGGAWLDEPLKQQLIRSYYLRLNLIPTFFAQLWALRPAYLPKTIPVETSTAPGKAYLDILLYAFFVCFATFSEWIFLPTALPLCAQPVPLNPAAYHIASCRAPNPAAPSLCHFSDKN